MISEVREKTHFHISLFWVLLGICFLVPCKDPHTHIDIASILSYSSLAENQRIGFDLHLWMHI